MAQDPLKDIKLFDGLTEEQLATIQQAGEVREYEAGETIITEGEEGTLIYGILSGRVEISVALSNTAEQMPVHVAAAGSVFGDFELFERQPRSATVRSIKEVALFAISAEDLEGIFQEDPMVGFIVMRNLCRILVDRMRKTTTELRSSLMW